MIPFIAYEMPRRSKPIFLEKDEVHHVRALLIPELGNANAIARVDSKQKSQYLSNRNEFWDE